MPLETSAALGQETGGCKPPDMGLEAKLHPLKSSIHSEPPSALSLISENTIRPIECECRRLTLDLSLGLME